MTTSSSQFSRKRRACTVLAATLVMAIARTSAAQPAPSPADLESARELFKEGREARQSGDLRRALERFKAAHAYGQTPVTALELGRTHVQLGELVEGREMLLSVARMKVQSDETDKSAAARAEAADLAEDVKKRIPTVTVKLAGLTSDAGVQLTVDGAAVPIVGLTGIRKANPGKHVIIARVGAREETRNVDLQEGKTQDVAIDLAGASNASPATTEPVAADTTGKKLSPVTWIGLGVGVVGLGVGSITGIIALGKASNVTKECSGTHCAPVAKNDVDSGRSAATISTIGFAVGAAGLVTAVIGYFVLSKPSTSAFRVGPFVTASSIGVDGSF